MFQSTQTMKQTAGTTSTNKTNPKPNSRSSP